MIGKSEFRGDIHRLENSKPGHELENGCRGRLRLAVHLRPASELGSTDETIIINFIQVAACLSLVGACGHESMLRRLGPAKIHRDVGIDKKFRLTCHNRRGCFVMSSETLPGKERSDDRHKISDN